MSFRNSMIAIRDAEILSVMYILGRILDVYYKVKEGMPYENT